jgi:hypothetical protein
VGNLGCVGSENLEVRLVQHINQSCNDLIYYYEQERTASMAAYTRATMAVAIKYSIVERPEKIDEILYPEISNFLLLIKDSDRVLCFPSIFTSLLPSAPISYLQQPNISLGSN